MNHLEQAALTVLQDTTSDHSNPFDLGLARVFAISSLGATRLINQSPDVYAAIDAIPCMHKIIGEDPLIAIETCGWAAPVEFNDLRPPSEHPGRKRVRLVCVANRQGDLASALQFADDCGNPITNPDGQGSLSEAVSEAMRRLELVQSLPENQV